METFLLPISLGKKTKVTDIYFQHNVSNNKTDIKHVWIQKRNFGPNNEVYQRVSGPKNQGIFVPTNTPIEYNK
jgi:hypothetical protein